MTHTPPIDRPHWPQQLPPTLPQLASTAPTPDPRLTGNSAPALKKSCQACDHANLSPISGPFAQAICSLQVEFSFTISKQTPTQPSKPRPSSSSVSPPQVHLRQWLSSLVVELFKKLDVTQA